jgi:hypothetical protein
MSSNKDRTEEVVQTILNTKRIPLSGTKYNQEKLQVRCKGLKTPVVMVRQGYLLYNYDYADW